MCYPIAMERKKPDLPEIEENEKTPLMSNLLEVISWQELRIDFLEQEILKLKGETTKPVIKPSKMDDDSNGSGNLQDKKKRKKRGPGRRKTGKLTIHETRKIQPEMIPDGSVFKGYRDVTVQDIILKPFNTRFRLAQYQTPDGHYVSGQLPEEFKSCHFGKTLIGFILYQYHHQHVTQPLLLQQLRDLGVDISSGRLSEFLTEDLDTFHDEKDELLQVGLSVSRYVHTDDTGARHNGKNGYCTHIGNEFFAWYSSTESKSRINFLSCLSQGMDKRYVLNAGAMAYMERQKLPKSLLRRFEELQLRIDNDDDWQQWLTREHINLKWHRRILTEGALLGGLLDQGIPLDLSIISDDAGQFNVFDHVLCWIHAERVINRLLPSCEAHVLDVDQVREQLWGLYRDLKSYKLSPSQTQAKEIRERFDSMCNQKTTYATLRQALKRLKNNQAELLRVLDKPWLPLHNNLSERDIRDYVKKRKISGSTRSENGRRARDTFASLKKSCRKHGLSFWDFLMDRLHRKFELPPLSDLIRSAAACG